MSRAVTLVHPQLISRLKKQAKRLQRQSGRPHHELLEELARQKGFPNWHHLTLAHAETQAVERQIQEGLIVVMDIKEALDAKGEDFEVMEEVLLLRREQLIDWLRSTDKEDDAPEAELWEHLQHNVLPLRYRGTAQLPATDKASVEAWLHERLMWQPEVVLFKGQFFDVWAADEDDHEPEEDDEEPDEPAPIIAPELLRRIFGKPSRGKLVLESPDMMELYRAVEGPRAAWHWCLHCERAYPQGSYRQVGALQMCPYAGCEGDAMMDVWRWENVRRENTKYPETPELGREYPLHGTAGAGPVAE